MVITLLDDESFAVPERSIPDKCTISQPPLKQVRVITYKIRMHTIIMQL